MHGEDDQIVPFADAGPLNAIEQQRESDHQHDYERIYRKRRQLPMHLRAENCDRRR
jgi:hypothetical protein